MKILLVLLTIISDDYYRRANFTHSIALLQHLNQNLIIKCEINYFRPIMFQCIGQRIHQ